MIEKSRIENLRKKSRIVFRELGLLYSEYKDSGASISESHLLIEIAKRPHSTVGNLALLVNLDKSTTSRLIKGMEKKGWVNFTASSKDKRQRPLRITPQGRKIFEQVSQQADQHVEEALTSMDDVEQQCVLKGMELYAQALSKVRLKKEISIKPIRLEDEAELTKMIFNIYDEIDCNKPGCASNDEELHSMYEAYQKKGHIFFVVWHEDAIVGCGGIAPLKMGHKETCELRKMFLLQEVRGSGIGESLLNVLLDAAKKLNYKRCYLETSKSLEKAQNLYLKFGFQKQKKRLGDTGHWACDCFYEKKI